jgi:NADH:ubiquinone oxidoreductase subunit F (NADH-binding)
MVSTLLRSKLLNPSGPDLADHLDWFGPLPPVDVLLVASTSVLRGRGGAAFPVATKLESVAAAARATGRRPVVVANGAEGEPAAAKDAFLLTRSPHLVLDGLQLVSEALGADTVILATAPVLLPALAEHLGDRRGTPSVRLHAVDDRFLAGEESALIASIDRGDSLPRAKFPPIRERGVQGRPTLVQNVETLARLALLARGDSSAAVRTLVTRREEFSGIPRVDVTDVPLDQRLADVLRVDQGICAVLVGGYHGTWLPTEVAREVTLERESLATVGAALGAGVLAALPADRCGLRETARLVGYLAAESAGQCGPCLNGLPRIAAALDVLARPGPVRGHLLEDVRRWCGALPDRGACRHPDGSVRLVASALQVFDAELAIHEIGGCTAVDERPFLPVPGSRS